VLMIFGSLARGVWARDDAHLHRFVRVRNVSAGANFKVSISAGSRRAGLLPMWPP